MVTRGRRDLGLHGSAATSGRYHALASCPQGALAVTSRCYPGTVWQPSPGDFPLLRPPGAQLGTSLFEPRQPDRLLLVIEESVGANAELYSKGGRRLSE